MKVMKDSEDIKKKATIFDFINAITYDKKEWDSFSEMDKKAFSPFMIGRWLSMDADLLDTVNLLQKYTIGLLKSKEVYNLYKDLIPKQKIYIKYIKGKKEENYSDSLLYYLGLYFQVSKKELKEYVDIMMLSDNGIDKLIEILRKYGLDDKKIQKILKN